MGRLWILLNNVRFLMFGSLGDTVWLRFGRMFLIAMSGLFRGSKKRRGILGGNYFDFRMARSEKLGR